MQRTCGTRRVFGARSELWQFPVSEPSSPGPPETRTVGLQKHQASSIYSDMAEKYGGLKKELAKCYGQDIEAYVNGKTAFIEQVLLEIEKECENPEVA